MMSFKVWMDKMTRVREGPAPQDRYGRPEDRNLVGTLVNMFFIVNKFA